MGDMMKNLLSLTLILGLLTAGCAWERTSAPQAQGPAWNLVRFHESANTTSFVDLSVQADGKLTLVDSRGEGASDMGLLADENLETLARLIDALPPQSYAFPTPCSSGGFFVSVTRGGEVMTYASAPCDSAAPAALSQLHRLFDGLTTGVWSPKTDPVPFTSLLAGAVCSVHQSGQQIVRDRDALMQLLHDLNPGNPTGVPSVDFSRQMVVAVFLGDLPTTGYGVNVGGAELTDSGWLHIHLSEAAPGNLCGVGTMITQPFALVAVSSHATNVLFDTKISETQCQ